MLSSLRALMASLVLAAAPAAIVSAAAHAQAGPPAGERSGAMQKPPFVHRDTAREAQRYEATLRSSSKREGTAQAWRTAAEKALTGPTRDPRAAARALAQAALLDDKDAASWLALAKALLAVPQDKGGSDRIEQANNATAAAYLAYERSGTPQAKAQALETLADAYSRRSLWRPAIDAAKASLALLETPSMRRTYDTLRAEHGFRMLDYKVENEAATPRLCLQFSENLKAQAEWSTFVGIDGKDAGSLTAEQRQICIDGVAHGKRYEVTVRAGLPSAIAGESLLKTAELGVYIRDRSPSVRAGASTYVLPSRGQAGVPLTTVNTDRLAIEVYRIGDRSLATPLLAGDLRRQMSSYELSKIRKTQGGRVWRGEMPVKSVLNEEVSTAFPVAEAIGAMKPGVYLLTAQPAAGKSGDKLAGADLSMDNGEGEDHDEGGNGKLATQWFIVSDLGLTAFSADDGVHGFVRTLGSAEPAGDIEVRLVARNNEVLATQKTDARGYVHFAAGLAKGEAGNAPAILVAERAGGGDYAFLDLTAAAFDLTDRGVAGRERPGALEAHVFTERGVYKPGETLHLTAIVRDAALKAPKAMPMTVVLSRPDGVEHRRLQVEDQGFGGRTVSLALSSTVQTGTWRVRVHADPKAAAIGEVAFLVEDFVPERLDLNLEAPAGALDPTVPGTVGVKSRYLYGPPAADLALEGEVVVRARASDLDGYKGYRFGLADEQVAAQRKPLEALPRTDAKGEAKLVVELPGLPVTAKPLEAQILTRLREPGGRAVERSVVVPIDGKLERIGIKPLFDVKSLSQGEAAAFEVLLFGADGKPVQSADLRWQLQRIESRWQWYSRDGAWNYEMAKFTRRIGDGKAEIRDGKPATISVKPEWGRYKLEVSRTDAAASDPAIGTASMTFDAGWYGGDSIDTPEMLELALDKPTYKSGETAKLTIPSQGAGRALVAVLSRGLVAMQEVEVKPAAGARLTTVDVPVTDDWAPGAYVTAILYRPMDEKAKRMPSRSLGLKWVELDKTSRTIGVGIALPDKVPSASRLTVPVKLGGLASGEPARVVVAAVDLGVLNVTRYETPAPEKFFFSQRRLGAEIRDLYGKLIDGMRAEKGRIRSGGDGGSGLAMNGSPQAEKPLALFSGMVIPGADGTAKVDFDLPEFNGTVRVTAVAWSATKVGSAKSDVIVRDPVALMATAPRFLTMGDAARLAVDVHNVEGQAGTYRIVAKHVPAPGTKGEAATLAERSIELATGQRRAEALTLKAERLGSMLVDVRVTGPGGLDVGRRLALDVKPPGGDIRRSTISMVKASGGKLSLAPDLIADLIPDRTKVTLSVGPAAGFDVAGLLLSLDRYPHGCAEQTTSRAMPLVYLNEMAKLAGLKQDDDVKARVQKAIERLWEMQEPSGAFGIWGPRNGDLWLTAYVTDFLTRAKESGYAVQARPFMQALDKLANSISASNDFEKGGEDVAYALYVLARNGRAPIGELRYFADTRIDKFATPLARTQIGAALGMLGDKERADRAFKAAMQAFDGKNDAGYRADYGSSLRDGAAMLTLASEVGFARGDAPRLATLIGRAMQTRTHTSTQENAWMLLAARSLVEEAKRTQLLVNGKPHQGALVRSYDASEVKAGGITIVNQSDADTSAVVTVTGDAATPEPAASKGFKIERAYYTLDGKPFALASATGGAATLTQNQRLIAVVKIVPEDAKEGRIIVVDRLPAGLEIENPRLIEGASLKSMPWLEGTRTPEHAEFRDDRFVAAIDLSRKSGNSNGDDGSDSANSNGKKPGDGLTFAYMVRAVSPGTFVHPAATVEDMYRPERFARTASGKLEVKAP